MRHKTKDKGDLAVAKTLAHLLEHDIRCCLPLSEHLPFDLIAVMPDMRTLRRVQVKYRALEKDHTIELSFRSNYYDSKRIYSKRVNLTEIDSCAVYCPEKEQVYYLRVDEIPENAISVTMRCDPPRNGQMKNVWLAKHYIDPYRIADSLEPVPTTKREVSEQDELATSKITADLVSREIQPFITPSAYLPFDLIGVLQDMTTLLRIRVGYQNVATGEHIDQYAIYHPDLRACFYFDAADIPPNVTTISLETMMQFQKL